MKKEKKRNKEKGIEERRDFKKIEKERREREKKREDSYRQTGQE